MRVVDPQQQVLKRPNVGNSFAVANIETDEQELKEKNRDQEVQQHTKRDQQHDMVLLVKVLRGLWAQSGVVQKERIIRLMKPD